MKVKILQLFLLVFVFIGCSDTKEEDDSQTATDSTTQVEKPVLKDGPFVEKFPNGQVRMEGEIKNGTRFGQWTAYYPTGTKQSENYFEDGKKNGKTATYYKNGKIRYIGYFKWDKPEGMWEFYDSTGVLATKKEYK